MMEANLDNLRQLCSENRNIAKINKIIESLHDRQDYARYHFKEFQRLSIHTDKSELIMVAISEDNKMKEKRLGLKANIMACIQSIHITHDLLSQLISKILELEIIDRRISFYEVVKKLSNLENIKYKILLELLIKLRGEKVKEKISYFDYITAIVNHSKHTFTIEPAFKTTFFSEVHRICYFAEFTYKGNLYPEIDAEFLINSEYIRESKLIIEIENELISILT